MKAKPTGLSTESKILWEVLRELKGELASRYLGTEGKIEELLTSDPQFQAALKVLNNNKVYDKLLNEKE